MAIEKKYTKLIFSILIKKESSQLVHLGTGFFIGLNGLFFTCGHTFRKIEKELKENGYTNIFVAFPNKDAELYKIKSLYYKSFMIHEQKGPEYRDAAVGIIDFNNTDYLIFNRKRPKNGEILRAIGIYNKKTSRLHDVTNNKADLSEIELIENSLKVINQEPIISDLPKDFQIPRDKVNSSRFFNNCVAMDEKLISGESGCPVVDPYGLVSGVFIAGSGFNNTSVMLLGKYCTKVIRCKTYYQYDIYQDLIYRTKFSAQSSRRLTGL